MLLEKFRSKLFALIPLAFLLFMGNGIAQIQTPVTWKYSVKKLSDCEFQLVFTASIKETWHLYSQIPTDDGPLPTVFNFTKDASYSLEGKTIEPKPIAKPEPVFDNAVIRYFEKQAVFTQKIKVTKDGSFKIKGTIDGMSCNESQCVKFDPSPDFEFSIENAKACAGATGPTGTGCVCDTAAILLAAGNKTNPTADTTKKDTSTATTTTVKANDNVNKSKTKEESDSWLFIFLTGFAGGLAALFTPCVFPMIPMTVSFFTKRSKTKAKGISNAMIYSASIIIIYVALGLGITIAYGSDKLNDLSTNIPFNIFFFLLLLVFAISFFGAFEITLPSRFVNKMDSASDKGGLIGIFFMAFTLSLVSFSCTGPIIGSLLVKAASSGEIAGPFWGMFGFSLALSFPFGFFAAFPGWMNSLPKSGGWLNSVKVFLGFIELAFAFKFLSNADLVGQYGFLTREIFLAIWIAIFALLGIYLMGWFKLPHDSDMKHVSVFRFIVATFSFIFTVYMIPGLWGAPLKLLSGVIPPSTYSESPHGFGSSMSSASEAGLPDGQHLGPHDIPVFDDYDLAMAYAKKMKKPLMLDFTGWACANCRRMEDKVWSEDEIKKRLSKDVVLVSLYVDDKRALPADKQVEVEWNGKRTLKTIGNKWSYLQATKFQTNAQPQYWIVNYAGDPVEESSDYNKGHVWEDYAKWIDNGVKEFQRTNK